LKALRLKRPDLEPGEWMFHWDNAPVHTAEKVQRFWAKKKVQVISHPSYSPDLAPADYFLLPTLKRELAGLSMTLGMFKNKWEGVVRKLTTSPEPSRGGYTTAKSGFLSAVDTAKKVRKYIF
jgi:hypothetical protein